MLPTTKIQITRHGREQVHNRLGPRTDEEIIQMIRQSRRLSERLKAAIRKVAHPNFFGRAAENLYLESNYGLFVLRPVERGSFILLTFLYRDDYDAVAEELEFIERTHE